MSRRDKHTGNEWFCRDCWKEAPFRMMCYLPLIVAFYTIYPFYKAWKYTVSSDD